MSEGRYVVIPSRMSLLAQKQRLIGAKKGHKLLKQKSDALNLRFREVLKEIRERKKEMIDMMKKSNFCLSEARFASTGDITISVLESVNNSLGIQPTKVRVNFDNVAGVRLPVFDEIVDVKRSEMISTSKGGIQVENARKSFSETLSRLIELASLQTSFLTLEQAIKVTNRRVNALDKVVVPKIENTIKYIDSELDELEREEKFKLKKIGKSKEISKKKKLTELREKKKEIEEEDFVIDEIDESTTILDEDDEDIVV